MNSAIFLDRDGVINNDMPYIHKVTDFVFNPLLPELGRLCVKHNLLVIIVTNQAGIGRGYYSKRQYYIAEAYVESKLKDYGLYVTKTYHCPYHPEQGIGKYRRFSYGRKPYPGMLLKACKEYNIDPKKSFMVGNNDSDRIASISMGILQYFDANDELWLTHLKAKIRQIKA